MQSPGKSSKTELILGSHLGGGMLEELGRSHRKRESWLNWRAGSVGCYLKASKAEFKLLNP